MLQVEVEKQPGNNGSGAISKGKAVNRRCETGHRLVDEELAALREDKSGQGRDLIDDRAGGRSNERVEIWACKCHDLMPVCQEEGAYGSEGATSDVG